jgi:predicted NBD/HSP70 family sugar kinase
MLVVQAKRKRQDWAMLTARERELLQLVHGRPGITRAQAAAMLAASSGTVTGLVRSLSWARLLDERPAAPTGARGRPTRRLVPHPSGPLVLVGVVSHESWRLSVTELGGRVIAMIDRRHGGMDGASLVRDLRTSAASLADRFPGRIRGTGLALPGVVRGNVLLDAPLLGWRSLDMSPVAPREGSSASGLAHVLVVGNDATLAALGEAVRGAAKEAELHLHLYLDAGLGGALTHRGVVVPGALGLGGEFGHMPFGDRTMPCPCGATGCWTTAVGARPLAVALNEPLPADAVSYATRVVERARLGDAMAREALALIAASLGRGIAGLVNGLDIDFITLGGWAPEVAQLMPDVMTGAYMEGLMRFRRADPPPLVAGELGKDAPRAGASEQVWSRLWTLL